MSRGGRPNGDLMVGVGPYFAKNFAKFHPFFRERNFRGISPLLGGFGEISAKFSKFPELGPKFRQNTAKFGRNFPILLLGRKKMAIFRQPPRKSENLRRNFRKFAKFRKFREIFAKFWPFLSEIAKEISPLSRRNKG